MQIKYHVLLSVMLLLSSTTAIADFSQAVVAFHRGEYERAYATLRSLSETTNDEYTGLAQYYLGVMYLNGQGIEQDYTEAAKWLRKAAERHIEQAQFKLGNLYLQGNGLPKDYEYAYAWYRVGAAFKHKQSIQALAEAKRFLSPAELAEAEKLSAELIQKYGPREEDKNPPSTGSTNKIN